jgi:hypothetical protein
VPGDRGGELELIVRDSAESLLEVTRESQMQLAALAGQEVVVEGLAQQRVAKAELPFAVGYQDLLGQRIAQPGLRRSLVQSGQGGDRRLAEGPPDGDRAGNSLGVGREAFDPHQKSVAQALGCGSATSSPTASSSSV